MRAGKIFMRKACTGSKAPRWLDYFWKPMGRPEKGELIKPNFLLASTDRVALDAVDVAILRHHGTTQEVTGGKIFEQEQISRAATLGVGIVSAHQIDLVSLDEPSEIAAHMVKNILDSQS